MSRRSVVPSLFRPTLPYGDAGAGGRVIIGQLRVWSAGSCLIIVVRIPTDCPSVLAVCKTVAQP